jgi:hypothetical protein
VRRAIGLLALPALLAAGCGGGDDSTKTVVVTTTATTATTAPLSRAEYIAQSDAICADYQATTNENDKQVNRALHNFNYERAARVEKESIEGARMGYEQLAALPKPKGDEEVLAELDDLRNQLLVLDRRWVDAALRGDSTQVDALLDEFNAVAQRKQDLETGYGLDVCGQNTPAQPE